MLATTNFSLFLRSTKENISPVTILVVRVQRAILVYECCHARPGRHRRLGMPDRHSQTTLVLSSLCPSPLFGAPRDQYGDEAPAFMSLVEPYGDSVNAKSKAFLLHGTGSSNATPQWNVTF